MLKQGAAASNTAVIFYLILSVFASFYNLPIEVYFPLFYRELNLF